ncbi:DUF4349 domain-containing protein [Longispora albida]|uniref:DUF4349 domain-containing protein n=1 Tax=Longispora albida TaxID=203523 RepID=UPI0003641180|nr:DUF4349 domain-containing protein [Longispora albida]
MRTRWTLIPAIAITVALAACSAPSGERASDTAGKAPAAAPGAAKQQEAKEAKQADPVSRAIVYTGTLSLQVSSVDTAANEAGGIASRAKGFVGGETRTISQYRAQATITLRIPSSGFYAAVTELAKLGTEQSREVKTEDVTTTVIDVDARITAQRMSVARIRELLAKAGSLQEISAIESELAKREGELGSLEARKRALDDSVALSTITLRLTGPDAPPAKDKEKKEETGFLAGLSSGWSGFKTTLDFVLTALGLLLPFLLALAIPAGALWWLIRRRTRTPSES